MGRSSQPLRHGRGPCLGSAFLLSSGSVGFGDPGRSASGVVASGSLRGVGAGCSRRGASSHARRGQVLVDVVAVEPLVLQRLELPLDHPLVSGALCRVSTCFRCGRALTSGPRRSSASLGRCQSRSPTARPRRSRHRRSRTDRSRTSSENLHHGRAITSSHSGNDAVRPPGAVHPAPTMLRHPAQCLLGALIRN